MEAPPSRAEALRRAERRRMLCESLRARALERAERVRRMHDEIEAMRERGPELRWLRLRVMEMLAEGWTREEMAEVGITPEWLRSIGLFPTPGSLPHGAGSIRVIRANQRDLPSRPPSRTRAESLVHANPADSSS